MIENDWLKSDAIQKLLPAINNEIFLSVVDTYLNDVVETLKKEGEKGLLALENLIKELLKCRNERITLPLAVAEKIHPSASLFETIKTVYSAPGLINGERGRFTPEIEGGGKIGWTDGTEEIVRKLSKRILKAYSGEKIDDEKEIIKSKEILCVHCGKPANGHDIYDWQSKKLYSRCIKCSGKIMETELELAKIRSYPKENRNRAIKQGD